LGGEKRAKRRGVSGIGPEKEHHNAARLSVISREFGG